VRVSGVYKELDTKSDYFARVEYSVSDSSFKILHHAVFCFDHLQVHT
jgi:hypothetical protein